LIEVRREGRISIGTTQEGREGGRERGRIQESNAPLLLLLGRALGIVSRVFLGAALLLRFP